MSEKMWQLDKLIWGNGNTHFSNSIPHYPCTGLPSPH